MKKHLPTIILIAVFVIGLSLLLYPTVSDRWNSYLLNGAINDYKENVSDLSDSFYEQIIDGAHTYNEKLKSREGSPFVLTDEEIEEYNSILDIDGNGMMGYIEIPVLQTKLPVYHGTSDSVLSAGVGHIEGSSLPVGGEGTHCVLSGHRGLPSAKLFTNLDEMVEGDTFIIHVLDESLTYEVDQIRIVEPDDTSNLLLEPDKDYCTLVTCTPYGINTHRLLVRGHRVEGTGGTVRVTSDAVQLDTTVVAAFIAVPILLILFVVLLIKTRKRKRS